MNDFKEYKFAKVALCKLICQFYDYYLPKEEAKKLGINYEDNEIFNSYDKVNCVYHRYYPEGLYIWDKLGIDKPIITMMEMWKVENNVAKELYKEDIDYAKEATELKLIDLYMITDYYKSYLDRKFADEQKIEYDENLDEIDGRIEGSDHLFESAGEYAWNLLGFERNFIPLSELLEVEKDLQKQLLTKRKVLKK